MVLKRESQVGVAVTRGAGLYLSCFTHGGSPSSGCSRIRMDFANFMPHPGRRWTAHEAVFLALNEKRGGDFMPPIGRALPPDASLLHFEALLHPAGPWHVSC